MADYLYHVIIPLQRHFGLRTEDLFYSFGLCIGKEVATRHLKTDLKETLDEINRLWEGRLVVEKTDPLELLIRDHGADSQQPANGAIHDYPFQEGFFKSLVSSKLGKEVDLVQKASIEGKTGTQSRKFIITDVKGTKSPTRE